MQAIRKVLGAWLVVVLFLTSIIVTPSLSIDIFALPKTTFLVINVSTLALIVLLARSLYLRIAADKVTHLIFLFSITLILSSGLLHGLSEERLFGVHGRFNGLLTYLILFLMVIVIRSTFDREIVKFSLFAGAASNLVVGSYFLLQRSGRDPLSWANVYQDPSSTLGNPNFVSGFLATTTFCYLFAFLYSFQSQAIATTTKIIGIIGASFSVICILLTNSALGLVAIFVGLWFILVPLLISKFAKGMVSDSKKFALLSIATVTIFTSALLTFGKEVFDNRSVSNRLYYWQVSWNALIEAPLQGYGFDTTGEFFRTIDRPDKFGPTFAVDSSHNLVLDFASWAGIPLTLVLLLLLSLVLLTSLKTLLKSNKLFSLQSILTASVIAFFTQSLISVPTIAINAWGFLFFGALMCLLKPIDSMQPKNYRISQMNALVRILSVTLIIVPLVLFPIRFAKDVQFRNLAEAGDGVSLVNLVREWPQDSYHYWTVVHSLYLSDQIPIARRVGESGLEFNPKNYLLMDEMYRKDVDALFRQTLAREMRKQNPLFVETP